MVTTISIEPFHFMKIGRNCMPQLNTNFSFPVNYNSLLTVGSFLGLEADVKKMSVVTFKLLHSTTQAYSSVVFMILTYSRKTWSLSRETFYLVWSLHFISTSTTQRNISCPSYSVVTSTQSTVTQPSNPSSTTAHIAIPLSTFQRRYLSKPPVRHQLLQDNNLLQTLFAATNKRSSSPVMSSLRSHQPRSSKTNLLTPYVPPSSRKQHLFVKINQPFESTTLQGFKASETIKPYKNTGLQ